ncbi:uncharacterized protein FYW47_000365 [Aplochiton taeniatus]
MGKFPAGKAEYLPISVDYEHPAETLRSVELHKLLDELKTLYHERILHIDQSGHTLKETLQRKVDVLQSFVCDLTEQNEVLIQTLEDEGRAAAAAARASSLHRELERRQSLALCPMPTDLAGTTATPARTREAQAEPHIHLKAHLLDYEAYVQQLKEASLSQQETQTKRQVPGVERV